MTNSKEESGENVGAAIFQSSESYATGFMDKVRAIHERFDKDKDGYLSFKELSSLQLHTSGAEMDGQQFAMVCRGLDCSPNHGLNINSLRLVYAADGSSVDDDYEKIFGKKGTNTNNRSNQSESKNENENEAKQTNNKNKEEEIEEEVIEVGEGGVDISPDS